jgi:hypothetical protein
VEVARALVDGKATREELNTISSRAIDVEELALIPAVRADAVFGESSWIAAIFAAIHAASVIVNFSLEAVGTDAATAPFHALVGAIFAARYADKAGPAHRRGPEGAADKAGLEEEMSAYPKSLPARMYDVLRKGFRVWRAIV